MKNRISLFAILLLLSNSIAISKDKKDTKNTKSYSCCLNDDDMKSFASDPAFVALHPAVEPIQYTAQGKMISIPTDDKTSANAYVVPSKTSSNKWLFVYQEWWGLNDYIKKQADTFYNDFGGNVNVLALDMYDGKSATDPKEAAKLMQGVVETRLETIVKGAVANAGSNAEIQSVGWCFGGGWSLKSAIIAGKQNIGCVMYYGMPVKNVDVLKTLHSDVLGLFATEEKISKSVIEQFAVDMKTAGKTLTYKIFDAVHAFANPSNPKYDVEKSKEAYGMALAYLKERYKSK